MHRMLAPALAAVLILSTSAVAEPSDTLVVVLEKPSGLRQTHAQSSTYDSCHAMLQRFKELNEKRQPVMLDTLGGSAEALAVFCIEANGEGVDWKGASLTSEQIQQRTDELITEKAPVDAEERARRDPGRLGARSPEHDDARQSGRPGEKADVNP